MLKRFLITCTVWMLTSQNVYGDSSSPLGANAKRKPFLLRLEGAKLNQFKSDYNLFYSDGNPRISTAFLRKLQKDGSDEHSISANPLFVDMENEDFRLKLNSPMFERGFKQIDTSRIGLLPEFPQRWRDK